MLQSSEPLSQAHKKRKRWSLVCINCKRKKIRCDKLSPCSQCTKAHIAEECSYSNPEASKARSIQGDNKHALPYIESAKTPISFNTVKSKVSKKPKFTQEREQFRKESEQKANQKSWQENKDINSEEKHEEADVTKSELEFLKERLLQIEQSMALRSSDKPSKSEFSKENQNQSSTTSTAKQIDDVSSSYAIPTDNSKNLQSSIIPETIKPLLAPPTPQTIYDNHSFPRLSPISLNLLSSFAKDSISSIQLPPLHINQPHITSLQSHGSFSSHAPRPGSDLIFDERLSINELELSIGTNPYSNSDEVINFFDDYTSIHVKEPLRRINFGPFAWSSLMKRDPGLRLLWDYVSKQNEESSKEYNGALLLCNVVNGVTTENTNVMLRPDNDTSEKVFKKKALQADGYDEMLPYKNILKARQERNIKITKLNEEALSLGLTLYDGQIDRELQLIDKIQINLPKKKVIWKLINRFFTWLYPFMPFLDEYSFTKDIAKIIGPESYEDEKVDDIKVEKKLDLALIGILLIILRLAYLSLFCNKASVNERNLKTTDPSPDAQSLKYLLSNPININTIDVANLCLDQFQLLRKTNLTVLQLALYMGIYHTYAPEDGNGADGGNSQVLNAMLIQMAYSLGLNREPDKFEDVCNDPKLNNIGRKIWYYLVVSDIYISLAFGNPMSIDKIYYDTKLPFHSPGNENIKDIALDKYISETYFATSNIICPPLRKILSLVLNVEGKIKMKELCTILSDFELVINDYFGDLSKWIKPIINPVKSYSYDNNFRAKSYLCLKSFLISIYFHFHLYYETKNVDLSFFYLKKSLSLSCLEIMPYYYDLLGNSEVICDMIFNPTLEQVIHKSNQTNLASIIKVNFEIFHMRSNPNHDDRRLKDKNYCLYFRTLCKFSSVLTRCAEVSISAISKISNRYYYAWRITKGQTFLLKTITSFKFYEDNPEYAGIIGVPRYTFDQVSQLIKICDTALSTTGQSTAKCYSFNNKMYQYNNPAKDPLNNGKNYSDIVELERTTENAVKSKNNDNYLPLPHQPSTETFPPTEKNSETADNIDSNFGFDFVDNQEIDRLWLNMISFKHDTENLDMSSWDSQAPIPSTETNNDVSIQGQLSQNDYSNATVNSPNHNGRGRFGFDMELASKFDIFSDIPFDKVFKFD